MKGKLVGIALAFIMVATAFLSLAPTITAAIGDDYFLYSTHNPANIGDVTGVGGYVQSYGDPKVWGDEVQFVYFLSGTMGYKFKVWLTDNGAAPSPGWIEPHQHPENPYVTGPIEPRHFQYVSSKDLSPYTSGSGSHSEEFHVDSSGIYLGAYNKGIHKWDHSWNYIGKIANSPGTRTESLAYNPDDDVWYAGGRYRTIYELSDTDNDNSFLDETWVSIFTYPSYGGGHHDGMEYVGGYLWISDMTSDVLGQWYYDTGTSSWTEKQQFTYTEVASLEGMGFGPNDHFWAGSGWGDDSYFYEIGGGELQKELEIPVDVDIKPGSCPNPINPKGKGVLPVAICGTDDLDVTTIDPATILLTREEYPGEVEPLRWSYEDVATPFEGELCDCHDENGDGIMDLTFKFRKKEVIETLELADACGDTIPLTITGNLKEEEGETPIIGHDCVWVLLTTDDKSISASSLILQIIDKLIQRFPQLAWLFQLPIFEKLLGI